MAYLDIRRGKHGDYQKKYKKLRYKYVRPFIYEECHLGLQDPRPKQTEEGVKKFLVEKIEQMIQRAKTDFPNTPDCLRQPLIRLKVEYTDYPMLHPRGFGQGVDMNTLIEEELEGMEKSKKTGLQLLSRSEILNAVKQFVDKDENKSIGGMVATTMKEPCCGYSLQHDEQLEELVGSAETYKTLEDENDCLEKLKPFLVKRFANDHP
eukprot:341815-Hanusia_phi.AAC.6